MALAAVLLFHADGALPGGYLGVDLFFVLSGYLITSLLLSEFRETGRIDLYAFWARRCRRLFPALLSLIPVIAVYGRFFARPDELQSLRSEMLASLAYVANWRAIFAHRSYWQLFAAPSPLEHTWSLSIEEQFYLVWPVLAAWLLRRGGRRALLALALALSAASIAATLLLFSPADTSRVYLGTDTRMVAVLLGAALAMVLAPGTTFSDARSRALDLAGVVAACGVAVAWLELRGTDDLLYRGGFWLTELAALILIACGVAHRHGRVARALSVSPLRLLGKISYGVYLWHWPINVFVTTQSVHLHGFALQLLRLSITFAIAAVSYRYWEQPLRQGGIPLIRPHLALPAALASAALLVVQSTEARAGESPSSVAGTGVLDSSEVAAHLVRYRVVVFGDSTANSLGWGLRGLHEAGLKVDLLGKDGCNMLGDHCNGEQWATRVRELQPDATLIYLAGAFLHGFSVEGSWHTACHADWDAQFEQALTSRLRELEATQRPVYVLTAPYPLGHWDTSEYRQRVDCINASLRKAAQVAPSVRIIDAHEQLCPSGICRTEAPGAGPIRPDGVHFSIQGASGTARWVLQRIRAH